MPEVAIVPERVDDASPRKNVHQMVNIVGALHQPVLKDVHMFNLRIKINILNYRQVSTEENTKIKLTETNCKLWN